MKTGDISSLSHQFIFKSKFDGEIDVIFRMKLTRVHYNLQL